MRRPLLSLATIFALAVSSAPAAEVLGFAESSHSFTLQKGVSGMELKELPRSVLHAGDAIVSVADRVQMTLKDGLAMVVGAASRVLIGEEGEPILEQGEALVATNGAKGGGVRYADLRFRPSETQDGILQLREIADGVVEATGIDGTHLVQLLGDGKQLAVVGAGDVLRFLKTIDGWEIQPGNPITPRADSPIRGNTLVMTGALNEEPIRAPLALWWGAAGVGVAGAAAGTAVYFSQDDDEEGDDAEDDDPPPFSPISAEGLE